ncbi:hypothetical protein TWF694_010479 [Orbilia ellipsospora]|uniref:Pentatricopeptide repeat protein n=1 Tax=Orbilia ellipsospora TaxID=2528407 RepID=A0AAV9XD27_9PEZI
MQCPRCLVRAYGAVLASHGYPNPPTTINQLIARRHITSGTRGRGAIRRPSPSFSSPPSTAVDKRGKLLTRGGSKSLDERRYNLARSQSRSAVHTEDVESHNDDRGGSSRSGRGGKSLSTLTDDKEFRVRFESKKMDPAKIAATIQKALDGTNKEHEEGVDMLRELTSRFGRTDLVVAWNHVIEWKLKRGNVSTAMKMYNEMKKRGTKPDSYTYLRILNGLAENAAAPGALGRALTVYYSMTAPTSTVKPSIIHTNAALKVCAHAKDVDAMWDIAERIPDRGRGQADATTYTTLLNGIRNSIDGVPDRAINEGRELWENILLKWQAGTVPMDEGLGCAMARLLLKSARPEDWDEVLSLCQDVFGLPRLIPKMGTKARTLLPLKDGAESRRKKEPVDQAKEVEDMKEMTSNLKDSIGTAIKSVGGDKGAIEEQSSEVAEEEEEPSLGLIPGEPDATTALITSEIPAEKPPVGNNALSLIMETCLSLRAYDTAQNYWDLITDSYNVVPDRDNYHARMRILSMQSDSGGCVALVKEMAANNITLNPNLFYIALNGCRRAGSIIAFNDAYKLVDLMQNHNVEVLSKTVIAFVRVATVTEDVEVMKRAWMRLHPGFFSIHKLIDPTDKSVDRISKDLECCLELVSLTDAILGRMYQHKLDRVDKEFADQVTNSRGKIQRYVNEYFNKDTKGNTAKPPLMGKIHSYRGSKKIDGGDSRGKLAVSSDVVGRWQKLGIDKLKETMKLGEGEELGPGEVSLKGLNFRPKRNSVTEAAGVRGDSPRLKRFLNNKATDYTAHYRPNKEKKRRDRERSFR